MLTTPLWTLWVPQLQVAMMRALRTKIEEQTQRVCSGRCLLPSRCLPASSKTRLTETHFQKWGLFHAHACCSSFNYISFSVHTNERSFHQKQQKDHFILEFLNMCRMTLKRFLFLCDNDVLMGHPCRWHRSPRAERQQGRRSSGLPRTSWTARFVIWVRFLIWFAIPVGQFQKCLLCHFFVFITGASGPRGFDGIGQPGNQGIPGKPGPQGDPGRWGNPGPPGVCDFSMCYQTYDLREHYQKGPNMWCWWLRGEELKRLTQKQQDSRRRAEDWDCGTGTQLPVSQLSQGAATLQQQYFSLPWEMRDSGEHFKQLPPLWSAWRSQCWNAWIKVFP